MQEDPQPIVKVIVSKAELHEVQLPIEAFYALLLWSLAVLMVMNW
jgi:hypothetical protein